MSTASLIIRIFLFVATFAIEVRVKADVLSLPQIKEVQTQPEDCLKQTSVHCALRVPLGKKFLLSSPAANVTLDQETSVIRLTSGSIRLVEGTVWVKAKESFMVVTEFGSAGIEKGDFWVSKTKERVVVSAIQHPVNIFPRGSQEALVVEPGLENWLGRVNASGRSETGIPVAISLPTHVRRWARLYLGKKSDFEKEALEFGETWKQSRQDASEIHQTLAKRKLANLESDHKAEQERLKREESRNRELREMLRLKVSGDLD